MNHRLQASGCFFFFPPPFSANPSCGGEGLAGKKELKPEGDPVPSKSKPISLHLCVVSISARTRRSLPLRLPPPFHPTNVTLLPRGVSFPGQSQTIPKPLDLSHPCLHPGACTSPHLGCWTPLDLPAGSFFCFVARTFCKC